ncbi:hypothetical protein BU24DRAFT_404725 [Aaosphaeria arxii CBS 175.79]|uniref:Uncharacterized protein n=1 Tax=Aaosphaeria arxii CBS 175.79 TaxID=1450172 RepID=A0A6A5Y8M8_9PLEO|nr:uncharacterized protein BU24DRAFT_404725 [Aaosphaeria arxii CBS 175.79]KAF2021758.1 hypothetical protein BU24DRAFT_404725 [Aaosphaeria arxii CBS 175.79]
MLNCFPPLHRGGNGQARSPYFPKFMQLPLELREYVYGHHIMNCGAEYGKKYGDTLLPHWKYQKVITYLSCKGPYVPCKDALLFVSRAISAEYGETLARYCQTARVQLGFFRYGRLCEREARGAREAIADLIGTGDPTSIVTSKIRRVELVLHAQTEFTEGETEAVLSGVFDLLQHFKNMERVYIWFKDENSAPVSPEEKAKLRVEKAKQLQRRVQKMVNNVRQLDKIKDFWVSWQHGGLHSGLHESSWQCRKDSQSCWEKLNNDGGREGPWSARTPSSWVYWNKWYCKTCERFRKAKDVPFRLECGHDELKIRSMRADCYDRLKSGLRRVVGSHE